MIIRNTIYSVKTLRLKGQCYEESMAFFHMRCCLGLKTIGLPTGLTIFVVLRQRATIFQNCVLTTQWKTGVLIIQNLLQHECRVLGCDTEICVQPSVFYHVLLLQSLSRHRFGLWCTNATSRHRFGLWCANATRATSFCT